MLRSSNIIAAVDDLKKHSLLHVRGEIAQLVYLASTRDYNTGKYHHDGLALCFTEEVAGEAVALCHEEVFRRVLEVPLKELVSKLEEYMATIYTTENFLSTWLTLEPYRMDIPASCDPLSAKLFCSNLAIALSVLESRAKNRSENSPDALPLR